MSKITRNGPALPPPCPDPDSRTTAALVAWAVAYADLRVAAERERWERAIGAEMPTDLKCWHQNAAAERPEVTAWVIRNLREREALAWSEGPNVGAKREAMDG